MWNIRPFHIADQPHVQALINAGLSQRFDHLDESANPDVMDIQTYFIAQDAVFLVVEDANDTIIGCGALIHENGSKEIARIVRVSVAASQQRHGLGRAISQRLINAAREKGYRRVLVETNSDWTSALRLYQSCGFKKYDRTVDAEYGFTEVHMRLDV